MSFLRDNQESIFRVMIGNEVVWERYFDWNAEPTRPLSPEDVWELLRNGCNWAEIACAAGVDFGTANVMMAEAARIHRDP